MPHSTATLSPISRLKLTITSLDKDGTVRVAAEGAITCAAVLRDNNPLADLLGETWSNKRVLLNLEKTQFIDSAAVGWLLSTNKQFKADKGRFIVHSIRPPVRQVLDMLKIGDIVTFADNEQAGLALLKPAARSRATGTSPQLRKKQS